MKKLETLHLFNCEVKLEQLLPLFGSCPKLVQLYLRLFVNEKLQLDEHLKKELKQGVQKLQIFALRSHIDNMSWPVIQEMS